MSKTTITGIILILFALATFSIVWYKNRPVARVPLVFSPRGMMSSLWHHYKLEYVEKDTFRTLDKQQDNITTSEGQSYTMLRAVIMDDRATFDGAYKWTRENLKRKEDNLYSWLFGKRADGSYGVLTDRGGYNSASDADSDIALALIFAHNRWGDDRYLIDAKALLKDIWDKEVVVIKGTPYLAANNVEKTNSQKVVINPSYLAPYAYRIFAEVDPLHGWMKLVDSSYKILEESSAAKLDKSTSAGLPPDWVVIDKKTGELSAPSVGNLTTNFSFDALRAPWRVALDYEWNKEPRALAYLKKLSFLSDTWRKEGKISASYSHDGTVVSEIEVPAMYAGVIGYFMVNDPAGAEEIYNKKIKVLYNPDKNNWRQQLSYYDDNWTWFGIGLYNHLIKPL